MLNRADLATKTGRARTARTLRAAMRDLYEPDGQTVVASLVRAACPHQVPSRSRLVWCRCDNP